MDSDFGDFVSAEKSGSDELIDLLDLSYAPEQIQGRASGQNRVTERNGKKPSGISLIDLDYLGGQTGLDHDVRSNRCKISRNGEVAIEVNELSESIKKNKDSTTFHIHDLEGAESASNETQTSCDRQVEADIAFIEDTQRITPEHDHATVSFKTEDPNETIQVVKSDSGAGMNINKDVQTQNEMDKENGKTKYDHTEQKINSQDQGELIFDEKVSTHRKLYIDHAAVKLRLNPFELISEYCNVKDLLNFGKTSRSNRTIILNSIRWRHYCEKLGVTETGMSISDEPSAADIIQYGYVTGEHSAFYTFLRAYKILMPVIENPSDELKALNQDENNYIKIANTFNNAINLALMLDLDAKMLLKLKKMVEKAQDELLEEISDEKNAQPTLRELFVAAELWHRSSVMNTNIQDRAFSAYFSRYKPIVDMKDVFTFKDDSDVEEKQTSQRKLSSAFEQAAAFLLRAIVDVNDSSSPLPGSWKDASWSFILSKTMGDLVIFVQSVLTEAAINVSESEYLQTVPRIYIAAEELMKNPVLQEKAESAGLNFETYIDNALLRPMLDEFTDRQITYVDRFAKGRVKEWNDNISQEEIETEALLWSSVPKKAEKTDFISSFKWAFSSSPTVEGTRQGTTSASSTTFDLEVSAPATEFEAQTAVLLSKLKGMENLVSFELALEVMQACKNGIQRLRTVNRATAKTAEPSFVTFSQVVGRKHIQKAFENAVKVLNSYDPKKYGRLMVPLGERGHNNSLDSDYKIEEKKESYAVEPSAVFTELVNVGDLVQQMVHVFFEEELVATKLVRPNNYGTPSVNAKRQFEQMLDDFLAEGLSRGIDVLMDQVEFISTTEQLGSDFSPVPNQTVSAGQTVACEKVISSVKSHLDLLRDSTEKSSFDVFQQEVGIRLFAALSKHIKKQTISVDGAINLIADANAYYSFILTLKQKNLTAYYEALKQISQLFLIDKRDAKQIGFALSDTRRYNNVLSAEDIIEFVKRRQDWPAIKSKVEKVLYGMFDCTIC